MSQVLSQSPANRDDCKGEAAELGKSDYRGTVISAELSVCAEMIHVPGGGAGAQTTDLPVG